MGVWVLCTSLVFRLNHLAEARQIISILLLCYIVCLLPTKANVCGQSQKKFVWTTAWPMEENYVTYKLVGPLIERQNITSGSNTLNQRNQANSHGHQQNYFLHLSTPKDSDDSKSSGPNTEPIKDVDRIEFNTEAELDELCKLDACYGEDQVHQYTAALLHPANAGKFPYTATNNTLPSLQKTVFSANRLSNGIHPIKLQKTKKHMSDMLNQTEKDTYFNPTAKARPHQLSTMSKLQRNTFRGLDESEVYKGSYYKTDILPKPHRISYEPLIQNDKSLQLGPLQKTVGKKTHTSSFSFRRAKPPDPVQFPKSAGIEPSNNDPYELKTHPFTKYNKAKPDSFYESPSNILKVVKIIPEAHFKLAHLNESSSFHLAESSVPGTLPKMNGRVPPYRIANGSISRLPASPLSIIKGSNRVVTPIIDTFNSTDNIKELISEAKNGRLDKSSEENNIVKSFPKSGNTVYKMLVKGEKQVKVAETSSSKKRRENPNTKVNCKEKYTYEHNPRIQPKIKKLPLRYRPRLAVNSYVVSPNDRNYNSSLLKDVFPFKHNRNN